MAWCRGARRRGPAKASRGRTCRAEHTLKTKPENLAIVPESREACHRRDLPSSERLLSALADLPGLLPLRSARAHDKRPLVTLDARLRRTGRPCLASSARSPSTSEPSSPSASPPVSRRRWRGMRARPRWAARSRCRARRCSTPWSERGGRGRATVLVSGPAPRSGQPACWPGALRRPWPRHLCRCRFRAIRLRFTRMQTSFAGNEPRQRTEPSAVPPPAVTLAMRRNAVTIAARA